MLQAKGFRKLKSVELHNLSDASNTGYGRCSYLPLVDDLNQVHCPFVMGKARVAPLKPVTIPRLELTAALVSIKVSASLQRQLDYERITEVFWTDNQVVLGYTGNDVRRFHVFVANRVQRIWDHSSPDQWRYVKTKDNPAAEASRGLSAEQLVQNSRWLTGPAFLWETKIAPAAEESCHLQFPSDGPEVKKAWTLATESCVRKMPTIPERLGYFSDFHRAKKAFALCIRFKTRLHNRSVKKSKLNESTGTAKETRTNLYQSLTVEDVRQAELSIIKLEQEEAFTKKIQLLESLEVRGDITDRDFARKRNKSMKQTSSLYRLDPFLDHYRILRVGGRIKHANIPYDVKHPNILPRKSHISEWVIRHYHQRVKHQERGMTLNALRSCGIWIIGGSSAVTNHISNCVTCRKLHGALHMSRNDIMNDVPFLCSKLLSNLGEPFNC